MNLVPQILRRGCARWFIVFSLLVLIGGSLKAASPVIEWSASSYRVAENVGVFTVRAGRRGDLSGTSLVSFASTNGTASAGVDYTGVAGTLVFLPGESNLTVNLPLLDNGDPQLSRFCKLSLVSFTNAVPGLQSNATVTILDDDAGAVLDPWFDAGSGANEDIFTLGLMADGRILAGGQFTSFNGVAGLNYLAVLQPDGAVDSGFAFSNNLINGPVYAAVARPDGRILIGGDFNNVGGQPRTFLAQLQPGGGLDTNFASVAINDSLRAILIQPDGRIVIAGRFTTVDGQPRNRLARLNADASLDVTFAPVSGANNSIRGLALQPDGRVIIGGQFTSYDGVARGRLARVLTNGTIDTTFDSGSGADRQVRSVAVRADGKIFIGGDFEIFSGFTRSCIARLQPGGNMDTSFVPGSSPSDQIRAVMPTADGAVWIGGSFSSRGDATRYNLALLNEDGVALPFTADTDFDVNAVLVQPDGQTLVAGDFSSIFGLPAGRLARLNTTTLSAPPPRVQLTASNLFVEERSPQTSVTVTRRGDATVPAQVGFTTRDGTATAGADYVPTSGVLLFAPYEVAKFFTLSAINDSLPETNESYFFALTNPAPPSVLVGVTNAVITIQSDDSGFEFTTSTFAGSEPEGFVVVHVGRGGTGADTVTVNCVVRPGTALAGVDFVATNGVLTFLPDETVKTFNVTILPDALTEGRESGSLILSNASPNASVGFPNTATLFIDDIDSEFSWGGLDLYYGDEGSEGELMVPILRTGNSHLPASVDYAFFNGTAINGQDFLGTNGTIQFAARETFRWLSVPMVNDGLVESTETYTIQLSHSTGGATIGANSNIVIQILDNDAGLGFVETNIVVSENSPSVTLEVRRFDDGPGPLSVEYFTSNGTALAGVNYFARSGALNFPIYTTTNSVTIPLFDECGLTNDRTFTVRLRNPSSGGALGTNSVATVTIRGNDRAGRRDVSFNLSPIIINSYAYPPIIEGLAALPNGQVLWGASGYINPRFTPLPSVVRLNGDGSLDPTWIGVGPPLVYLIPTLIVVLSDGRILQSGPRLALEGVSFTSVLRLSSLGWWDPTFALYGEVPNQTGRRDVTGLLEQPDGRILVAREAYRADRPIIIVSHPGILRLRPDGSMDPSFMPGDGAQFDDWGSGVLALGLQTDGRILVGGQFTNFSGVACRGLMRLQPNGAVDLSFSVGGNQLNVGEIKVQSDGKF